MHCLNCTAETSNGLALCETCRHTLSVSLVNLAAYFTDVDRIQPGRRIKVRSAYQSTPPPGVGPAIDKVSTALDHATAVILGWVRCLQDDRGITCRATTVPTACGWLEAHTASIATLDWASTCITEVRNCERELRRILDRADTGWYAGVCGNEIGRVEIDGTTEAVTCERHLYGGESQWVACPECGRTWDSSERRENLIAEARDHVAPVSVIARAVVGLLDEETSVQRLANRIDQWVKRERLTSLGVRVLEDGKPHRVYRIGDVFDLLGHQSQAEAEVAC